MNGAGELKKWVIHTFVTKEVKMAHRLGEDRYHFLGKSIGIPSPIRHYYQFRNTLIMFNRSYVPLSFKIKYLLIFCLSFSFSLFLFSQEHCVSG